MSAARRRRGAGARPLGLALLAAAVLAAGSALVASRDAASERLPLALGPTASGDAPTSTTSEQASPSPSRTARRPAADPRGQAERAAEPALEPALEPAAGVPPIVPALGPDDLPALRARDAPQADYLAAWRAAARRAPAELAPLARGVLADPATSSKERVALLRVAWAEERELAHELLRAVLLAPSARLDPGAAQFAARHLGRVAGEDAVARATLVAAVWPAREGGDAGLRDDEATGLEDATGLELGLRRRAAAALCAAAEPAELEGLRARLATERDEALREGCLAALAGNPRLAGR